LNGEVILYRTDDGLAQVQLRAMDGTAWLTQAQLAELFATTRANITIHLRTIFESGELEEAAVCKEHLLTAADGKQYRTKIYRLEIALAVGFRVRSPRGTQFRQWATTRLKDYLVKGFVLDEQRLKDPGPFDYFDELLEKIREIRASEKRFYQKVREVYATATDYDGKAERAQTFFATVQNKMLFAVTGHTAAELVLARADATAANFGLNAWKGGQVRKGDVTTAKNYLGEAEVQELNRIVVMFLDVAEDRATRRKAMTMAEWETELDRFLVFNERQVLRHAGRISHAAMEQTVHARFSNFDSARRKAADEVAEREHEDELARLVDQAALAKKSKRP
jgi:hypothetical protein